MLVQIAEHIIKGALHTLPQSLLIFEQQASQPLPHKAQSCTGSKQMAWQPLKM
jgi:hypothetical protein